MVSVRLSISARKNSEKRGNCIKFFWKISKVGTGTLNFTQNSDQPSNQSGVRMNMESPSRNDESEPWYEESDIKLEYVFTLSAPPPLSPKVIKLTLSPSPTHNPIQFTEFKISKDLISDSWWYEPKVIVNFDTKEVAIPVLPPYSSLQCSICSVAFQLNQIGKAHFIRHFAQDHFKCTYCSGGFRTFELCLQHEAVEHGQNEILMPDTDTAPVDENPRIIPSTTVRPCRGLKKSTSSVHPYEIQLKHGNLKRQSKKNLKICKDMVKSYYYGGPGPPKKNELSGIRRGRGPGRKFSNINNLPAQIKTRTLRSRPATSISVGPSEDTTSRRLPHRSCKFQKRLRA